MVLRRSKRLLITIGAVAALLAAGGISAASLVNRHAPAEPEPRIVEAAPPMAPDTHTVTNPAAKLSFDVTADWEPADDDETLTTSNGVELDHLVDWGPYTCQGAEYGRAFAGTGVAPNDHKAAPGRIAADLAAAVAADQYSDGHQTAAVNVAKPQPLTVDGAQGATVHAEATLIRSGDPCAGVKGTITVIALPTSAGVSVFVIGADLTPGPQQPTPLLQADRVSTIADSLHVTH
ncbi:hypothetical protein [Actinocrispum wychmicini]|uniref:hypothetical protein n=1 Tax=Actinocrispum wychmicini TaxID=1213861 RepID=UPI00104D1B58|nr:hypothetical protein [Actinocrispum wychmicini]